MFTIIGIVVVFGAVVAGYLMEHGNLKVLMQPAELIIIGGAAIGTVLIANPLHILKKMVGGLGSAFGGSKFNQAKYLETMKMMFELFTRARRDGLMALESDSDNPEQSTIFSKYPKFLKDHHALAFVCDSVRMASSGGIEPFDADHRRAIHHGRFPARVRHRRRRSRRRHHHGCARRPSRRNWPQSSSGAGRNLSRNFAVLRSGWPDRLKHGQSRGRRTFVLPGAAGDDRGFHERYRADYGRRDRPARHSRPRPAHVSKRGKIHQR